MLPLFDEQSKLKEYMLPTQGHKIVRDACTQTLTDNEECVIPDE